MLERKIQAISDGAVVVGYMTYRALPTAAAVESAGGAGYPVISDFLGSERD